MEESLYVLSTANLLFQRVIFTLNFFEIKYQIQTIKIDRNLLVQIWSIQSYGAFISKITIFPFFLLVFILARGHFYIT